MDGSVTSLAFNNIDDALQAAAAAGYTDYEYWNITAQQAAAACNAAAAFQGTAYDVGTHNCWSMAAAALTTAQTGAYTDDNDPNLAFQHNDPANGGAAAGTGTIP